MKFGSRLARFAFTVCANLHEREVIKAEQRLLTFLAAKDRPQSAASRAFALWIEQIRVADARRMAEIEARKIYSAAAAVRGAINSLPDLAKRRVKQTTGRLFDLLGVTTLVDRNPVRPAKDFALAVPFAHSLPPATLRDPVGVVAHVFYPDVAKELRSYLDHIPGRVDVYLSTDSPAKQAIILRAFRGWSAGQVDVRIAPNRGRDVAPKLITFRDVYDRHPIVLHLHGKKSPHESLLKLWRHFIFENLMGQRDLVSSILSVFETNPQVGMISADHYFPVRGSISWGKNLELAQMLGRRMGVKIDRASPLDFPSGSMFWARSMALKPLLELNLTTDDFAPESGQEDGTLAHAIERLYFYSCEIAGLKWIKVCRPELTHERGKALVAIKNETDLADYLENKAGSLGVRPAR